MVTDLSYKKVVSKQAYRDECQQKCHQLDTRLDLQSKLLSMDGCSRTLESEGMQWGSPGLDTTDAVIPGFQ